MDRQSIVSQLAGLPVADVRFFDSIGSTNEEALHWAAAGAADGSLVVANTQTQGRGRFGRRWITMPDAALALSLILHPTPAEMQQFGLLSPLGALAVCDAIEQTAGLQPMIKWPNDVLINRRKVAGLLVEAAWLGETLQGVIIGIGLNVAPQAVPPADMLLFPATSLIDEGGPALERTVLLRAILQALFGWRARLAEPQFWETWNRRLAFRGEWVEVREAGNQPPLTGIVAGIDAGGALLLKLVDGQSTRVEVGDVHLRPAA